MPSEVILGATRASRDRLLFMRKSAEIERAKREGIRLQTSLFSVAFSPTAVVHARVAIIVGKRFGTAVMRNRAKRRFRELARQSRERLVSHRAFLVFPKRQSLQVSFLELRKVWVSALHQEGLLVSETSPL